MQKLTIIDHFYRLRSRAWRNMRVLFPSSAEIQFVRLMGGKVIEIKAIRDPRTGFPMARILTMGSILNSELMKREVRVGKFWVDFGADTPYYKRGIEIDGQAYHNDIIIQQDRDDYFKNLGWKVLHVKPADMYLQPDRVRQNVIDFLSD